MHCKDSNRHGLRHFVGAVLACLAAWCGPAHADDPATGRELFQRVYETVERGDWSPVGDLSARERQTLGNYLLWPDLRAAWLRANLGSVPAADIDAFLARHGTLRPARELRYRYALHLGRGAEFAAFQDLYEQFYQGSGVATLDCLSLQAEIAAGRHARIPGRAIELWLVGRSQVSECDPVFDYLRENDLLGPVEYRKRFALAIEAREFRLARWLGRSIDQAHVDAAARWMQAQSDPQGFLARHERGSDSDTYRAQLAYAAERLTYRDPLAALRGWETIEPQYGFAGEQRLRIRRHIALWAARDNLADAYRLLEDLPDAAQNTEVLRWRARTSLRERNWQRLLADIGAMGAAEREREEWRYWHAVALQRTGHAAAAEAAFETLATERSYYGFLAADELGAPYALGHESLAASDAALAALENKPGFARARELFLVGLEGRGRSEWDAAVRNLADDEKMHAAVLAHRWGWHSRAIAVASSLGAYDDLAIRYPLPWQELFETASTAASIDPTWAYGVARSESLFMRDVRSRAGAIGLMQLMPTTGKRVARQLSLPYQGLGTLTDPAANIRLGTSYLGQMAERFGGNRVLATAAYNAGPQRVEEWLPRHEPEDARAWIENIPFNETRGYVKRVLTAETIFHWRMTGNARRLSDALPPIVAAPAVRLAAR